MAIVKGPLQMTGSVSNISFYTRRGSDQVIMRSKGGINADKIKRQPQFEGFRIQQKEWSGVTKLASAVRLSLGGLHRIADYNITSKLNSLANKMQKGDTSADKGKRPVRLSQYKAALDGFNFNRNYPFNSVVRLPLVAVVDREKLHARVEVPRIHTDIDLLNVQKLPFFRLIVSLGTVSDMLFDEKTGDYLPEVAGLHGASSVTTTDWFSAKSIVLAQEITVALSEVQISMLTDSVSVLLSIAVEFGEVSFMSTPVEVKYAGCGKVLRVV